MPAHLSMTSPVQAYLDRLHARHVTLRDGEVATYIPELAKADPDWFGIASRPPTATSTRSATSRQPFTIQSISKPFVYGLALEDHGRAAVLAKVGVEPTGEAFNSISLAPGTGRPLNPDDQRRRDRDDVADRGALRRRPPGAAPLGLLALRRAPARDRRGRLPVGEGDRPPQPRDRPHAAQLRHPDRGPRRRARPLLPPVLDRGRRAAT